MSSPDGSGDVSGRIALSRVLRRPAALVLTGPFAARRQRRLPASPCCLSRTSDALLTLLQALNAGWGLIMP